MIIERYGDSRVENICNDENYARQYFRPADVVQLKMLLVRLKTLAHINQFFQKPLIDKYRTEVLKGTKDEIISLRLNRKDRVEVKVIVRRAQEEDSIEILEVKGHYGNKKRK